MGDGMTARPRVVLCSLAAVLTAACSQAATYTTPRQLNIGDTYQLNPDAATGDEDTTCPKTDANDGAGGDNPYFRRHNVARAHLGGCTGRYWYTSAYQEVCTEPECGPCLGENEPSPAAPQYADYAPPFGPGANELTPGRYRIVGEYRFTDARPNYPAEYIVHHVGGVTTILKSQRDGALGSCPTFEIGIFELDTGSFVRVNDPGVESITFNRMQFTLLGPLGGIPAVDAGPPQTVTLPDMATLEGFASDDGQPAPLTVTWSQFSGPGTVTFADPHSLTTMAEFSAPGVYVLRLTVSDSLHTVHDDVTITVLAENAALTYTTQYEFDADPSTPEGVIDANPADMNGDGRLTRVGNGFGAGGAGAGIASGILRYIDNSASTGNFGWYYQHGGNDISFTLDMAVRVNAGVEGNLHRRSLGVSGGAGKNLGIRLHKTHDGSGACATGSIRLASSTGGTGDEACVDFSTPEFRRLRVTVDASDNTVTVYDLDAGIPLTQATGSGGSALSWADQINNLGGFHIGSISQSNTTLTDFELDYVRVLLGVAVKSATTTILRIGQCNPTVFADVEPEGGDGDVDVEDFGVFQRCYTGSSGTLSGDICRCFDRNSDNRIDEFDFAAFEACAATSRAGVPADPLCDGP